MSPSLAFSFFSFRVALTSLDAGNAGNLLPDPATSRLVQRLDARLHQPGLCCAQLLQGDLHVGDDVAAVALLDLKAALLAGQGAP